LFARLGFPFCLVEEIKKWNMMRTNKVIQKVCQSSHCSFEWFLGRCAVYRNHGVVACAGTQKQQLSVRWLPPRGCTVWR
jgi:hypothetical protein